MLVSGFARDVETRFHYNLITFLSNSVECLHFTNEYGIIKISIF
nr:MAG TPA: hypothetical protein [Caudoviricetes sp.]